MKRFVFIAFFALTLLSACAKIEEPSACAQQFSLTAYSTPVSRTSTNVDDFSVAWTSTDKMSVFNSVALSGQWSSNLKFTIENAETGKFVPASGVVVPMAEGLSYDWTAIYPYNSKITDPTATPSIPRYQTQKGNNSTSALAAADVLYGTASDTRTPVITMNHVGSLLKWTIKNTSSIFYSVESIVLTLNGEDVYTLTVTSGESLSPETSADFYMVIDPYSGAAGTTYKLSVNTSAGSFVQQKTIKKALDFKAGQYSSASVDCNPLNVPSIFKVKKNASGKWRLYKDDEEFFINGVAANEMYDKLVGHGGNVLRAYHVPQTTEFLPIAQETGAYVLAGISVGRERGGFDYDDAEAVAAQKEKIRKSLIPIISHPSIMGWIIGNELDSQYTNDKVWDAVNDIALMIKEMNPNALTTTALAGCKEQAVKYIKNNAKALDFLCINAYYPSAMNISTSLSNLTWDRPWVLSEYGPRGTWGLTTSSEPPLTSWGSCVEQTSAQKATVYSDIINTAINKHKDDGCIGSCAFVWGYQKHGAVLTWYGLFDKNGYSFPAVDELEKAWTGVAPAVAAPLIKTRNAMVIDDSLIADSSVKLSGGSQHTASVKAYSSYPLTYKWLIYEEGTSAPDGSLPDGIPGLIQDDTQSSISFVAPSDMGNYRLVVFAKDDLHKKIASAVIPFQVSSAAIGGSTPSEWTEGNIGFLD